MHWILVNHFENLSRNNVDRITECSSNGLNSIKKSHKHQVSQPTISLSKQKVESSSRYLHSWLLMWILIAQGNFANNRSVIKTIVDYMMLMSILEYNVLTFTFTSTSVIHWYSLVAIHDYTDTQKIRNIHFP